MVKPGDANPGKILGCGIGLRSTYVPEILSGVSKSDWFEVISENLFGLQDVGAGKTLRHLLKVREKYEFGMHGVALSIGSADPLNFRYLEELRELTRIFQPVHLSDHFCWTGVNGKSLHDLMPLPYTEECLSNLVSKVQKAQEFLGQEILLENVSSYLEFENSEMTEWEFIGEVSRRAGSYILLDINNVFVSSKNHEFNPWDYLDNIPHGRVKQIHLGGPVEKEHHFIDTHDHPILEEVWDLYEKYTRKYGAVSTIIERDDKFPTLENLETAELLRARKIFSGATNFKEEGRVAGVRQPKERATKERQPKARPPKERPHDQTL